MTERGGDPTHAPTARRLRRARERGEIPSSAIFLAAASLLSLPVLTLLYVPLLRGLIREFMPWLHPVGRLDLYRIPWTAALKMVVLAALVPWLFSLAAALILNPRLTVRGRMLRIPFSLPRPVRSFGRVLAGALFMAVGGLCLYYQVLSVLGHPPSSWSAAGRYVTSTVRCIWAVSLVLGAGALILAWHRFRRSLMMTSREVHDEARMEEGSPEMKSARRRRARE